MLSEQWMESTLCCKHLEIAALINSDYNSMYVHEGCQECISDGKVFKRTTSYRTLEPNLLNIPPPCALQPPYLIDVPYVILADKAFATNQYTMKPFEGNPENSSIERILNYRFSSTRRVVENAFVTLGSVFRVLKKPILLEPRMASKVVLATIYLHIFFTQTLHFTAYINTTWNV
ncbi:hypothetical protein JTB14_026711 [Gonioctena quinquepunctata]|nr:hypothetical protein JTB14_026711 [Gonioctena quinquepunctata]